MQVYFIDGGIIDTVSVREAASDLGVKEQHTQAATVDYIIRTGRDINTIMCTTAREAAAMLILTYLADLSDKDILQDWYDYGYWATYRDNDQFEEFYKHLVLFRKGGVVKTIDNTARRYLRGRLRALGIKP